MYNGNYLSLSAHGLSAVLAMIMLQLGTVPELVMGCGFLAYALAALEKSKRSRAYICKVALIPVLGVIAIRAHFAGENVLCLISAMFAVWQCVAMVLLTAAELESDAESTRNE